MAQDFEREYKSSISNSSGSATAFTATDSDDALISIRCVNKSAGSATVSTSVSSGTFVNASNVGVNLSTLTSGPTGTFNDSGNGAAGGNNGNCSGDNCRIGGSTGGASYDGNVSGGSGGSSAGSGTAGGAGTRGSGGGGGSAQIPSIGSTDGGNGGAGEIKFRYIRVS